MHHLFGCSYLHSFLLLCLSSAIPWAVTAAVLALLWVSCHGFCRVNTKPSFLPTRILSILSSTAASKSRDDLSSRVWVQLKCLSVFARVLAAPGYCGSACVQRLRNCSNAHFAASQCSNVFAGCFCSWPVDCLHDNSTSDTLEISACKDTFPYTTSSILLSQRAQAFLYVNLLMRNLYCTSNSAVIHWSRRFYLVFVFTNVIYCLLVFLYIHVQGDKVSWKNEFI